MLVDAAHNPASRYAGRLGFVPPLLPTLASAPPLGDDWLHEIKHDGYRTLLVIDSGRARAFTRNGHDWTDRYRRVVECAAELPCSTAILDGEMIVQDEHGRSDFLALRGAMASEPHRLIFYAFDLLHLDGKDVRAEPLVERRARLHDLLADPGPFCPIQFSEALSADGGAVFIQVERMGLEGIVSKKAGSPYRSGRSPVWLKTKCMAEGDFIVIGTERPDGKPPLAHLARQHEHGLTYAGSAFVTLPGKERDRFWSRTAELAAERPMSRSRSRNVTWCRPELRVRARYLRGAGMIRHATVAALLG